MALKLYHALATKFYSFVIVQFDEELPIIKLRDIKVARILVIIPACTDRRAPEARCSRGSC